MLTLFAFKKNQKITKTVLLLNGPCCTCILWTLFVPWIVNIYYRQIHIQVFFHIQVYFHLLCCILSLLILYVLIFSIKLLTLQLYMLFSRLYSRNSVLSKLTWTVWLLFYDLGKTKGIFGHVRHQKTSQTGFLKYKILKYLYSLGVLFRAVIKRRGPGISPGYYECGPRLL